MARRVTNFRSYFGDDSSYRSFWDTFVKRNGCIQTRKKVIRERFVCISNHMFIRIIEMYVLFLRVVLARVQVVALALLPLRLTLK